MKKEILYQEIARTIACQIKKGVWKAGEKLPSLRTISNENGVSLNTAIQAYYELEKDGFIISRPKSGYIVNYKPIRLSVPATTQPSVKLESKEVVDLIADVYSSLEIGDKSITRFSLGMPEDILGNYILLYTISKIIKGHMIMYPFIIQSFFSFFFPSLLF